MLIALSIVLIVMQQQRQQGWPQAFPQQQLLLELTPGFGLRLGPGRLA
jgi:hypothetical protein